MTKKYCVYTCLVGTYDALLNIMCTDERFDYICFTDQQELIAKKQVGIWQIRKLLFSDLDNTRNNRWHKILGYRQLTEYEASIYIDSNITIMTPYVYGLIESGKQLIIPCHMHRDCIYEEIDTIYQANKDGLVTLQKIKDNLVQNGMPRHYGLNENNLIIRRHDSGTVQEIMEQWWYHVVNFSKRDQLSLSYVLWKNEVRVSDITISNVRTDKVNFSLFPHLSDLTMVSYFKIMAFSLYLPDSSKKVFIIALKGTFLWPIKKGRFVVNKLVWYKSI